MKSKSAQNRLVVLADLPQSNVPNIGVIPSHYLFPVVGKLKQSPEFFLHSDGSIFQLFKMDKLSMPLISKTIDKMSENASIQIYKLKSKEKSSYYICIRVGIDYSYVDLKGKKFISKLFSSYKCYWQEAEQRTAIALNIALNMIPEGSVAVEWKNNELIDFLCDYSMDNNFMHTSFPIKSNISAILSGQGKYSCIFSINNLDAIPMVSKILDGFCYIETITIVKPGKAQVNAIENNLLMNKQILEAIRPTDITNRSMSVDTIDKDISSMVDDIRSGLFFINVSFCMKSEVSMSDMKENYALFEETMNQKGIALYSHSNSARAAYISTFPGNSVYGEHWNTVYKRFGVMLISKVMAL